MLFRLGLRCCRAGAWVVVVTLLHPAAAQGADTAWDTLERILTVHEQMVERHRDEEAYRERVAEESWEESLEGLVLKLEPGAMSIRMRNLAIGRSGSILFNDPQPTLQALAREPRYLKLRELATQGPASVRRGIHEQTRDWLEDWTAQLDAGTWDLFHDKATPEVVALLHVQSSEDALEAGRRVLRFLDADLALFARTRSGIPLRHNADVTRFVVSTPCSGMSIAALKLALDRIAAQADRYLLFNLPAHRLIQEYTRCTGAIDDTIIGLVPQLTGWFREDDFTDEATLRGELEQAGFWEKASMLSQVPCTRPCPGLRDPSHYVEQNFRTLAALLGRNG